MDICSRSINEEEVMSKGFEPAVPLPVLQPSMEERLAVIALCEANGWEIPVELQLLKNDRDVAASAGFQRPPVGTVSERAQAIKQNAARVFDTTEATVVPDFLLHQNSIDQRKIQVEIDRLMRKPEGQDR
jgi:hypothetical protein